jgi:hypothetical protein
MNRKLLLITGILLILLGLAALSATLVMPLLGFTAWTFGVWRLWPLLVISLGALLVMLPLLASEQRGLGALFIPGVPVLAMGSILLFASVFDAWEIWRYAWPGAPLALSVGFLLAAWRIRAIGLIVPAIILGINGLIFQFCAITGWWSAWAVLWALEPLSVGLALLALNLKLQKRGLFLAGVILCSLAAVGLIGMSFLVVGRIWINLLGPLILVGLGAFLLLNALLSGRATKTPQVVQG